MKKQEILLFLKEQNVELNNLKSSYRLKLFKNAIDSVRGGYEKVKFWLVEEAEKERINEKKINDIEKAKSFNLSFVEYSRLKEKAIDLLESFNTHHSMGCYRTLEVNGRPFINSHELYYYSNGCKYTPTYGKVVINLNKIELRNITNIGGLWTIVYSDGSAKWLTSAGNKQTYCVYWTNGYVCGNSHSEISLEDAENLEIQKQEVIINAINNDKKFIGVQHIKRLGACDQGINAFIRKYNLDINHGYNLGYLKSLNDGVGNSYFQKV